MYNFIKPAFQEEGKIGYSPARGKAVQLEIINQLTKSVSRSSQFNAYLNITLLE